MCSALTSATAVAECARALKNASSASQAGLAPADVADECAGLLDDAVQLALLSGDALACELATDFVLWWARGTPERWHALVSYARAPQHTRTA